MEIDVFTEARRVLSSTNIYSFVTNLLPQGRKESNEWVAINPNRNDQNLGSFKVNLTTGTWCDFASGDKGDLISLHAYIKRISDYDAACQISGTYFVKKNNTNSTIPAITAQDTFYHNKKYNCSPSAFYLYQAKNGTIIGYMVRYDFINAQGKPDKAFAPYIYNFTQNCWSGKNGFAIPRPLYNLHAIATDKNKTIIVNEGEKCCLASQILFPEYIATTSPFGSNSPSKTDWQPLVARDVIIVPDHHYPSGYKYAEEVKKLVEKAGGFKSLTIFNSKLLGSYLMQNSEIVKRTEEVPQGYDLADAVKDGWTQEFIQQAIKDARFSELLKQTNVVEIINTKLKADEEELKLGNKKYKLTKTTLYLEELVEQVIEDGNNDLDTISNKKILVPKLTPLCGYLKVIGYVRDSDSDNWGLSLNMINLEGAKREVYLRKKDIAKDGAIITFLLDKGLEIHDVTNKKRNNAIYEYINKSKPNKFALGVEKIGWHDNTYIMPYADNKKNSYVINSGQQTNNEEFILQCDISALRRQERKGNLQSWQEQIGKYCSGNSRLVIACCAALTSTILSKVGEEGFCLHLAGSSSKGKSTALYVAGSIFGTGSPESFRTTDNAAESTCKNANDGLLLLDELKEIDANSLDKLIYMFGNGKGKARAKKDGTMQKAVSFTVLGISSGEMGVVGKLAEKNKTVTAGQGVRFIEILAELDAELGIFENIYHFDNAAIFAEHLQRSSFEHCGVVIDQFMQSLVKDFSDIMTRIIKLRDEWLKKFITNDVDGQIRRVAKKFALIAAVGEIAIMQGILPFTKGEAVKASKMLFDNWVAQRGGTGSFELQTIKNKIISFIQEERNARLLNANGQDFDRNIKNIAGYIKYDNLGMSEEYWLYPNVFNREIIQSPNTKFFYKELVKDGFIIVEKKDRLINPRRKPFKGEQERFVVIPASILNKAKDNDDQ